MTILLEQVEGELTQIYARLDELETRVQCERQHYQMREEDRVERWHRTRDAWVVGLCARSSFSVDHVEKKAVENADRAHGPIEGKVPESMPEMTDEHMRAFVDGLLKADPRVNALVKACSELRDAFKKDVIVKGYHPVAERFVAALIPFEREDGRAT